MRFFQTGLAIVCGLILTATGLWAGGESDSDSDGSRYGEGNGVRPRQRPDVDRARVWRDTHVGPKALSCEC